VRELRSIGILADMIMARSDYPVEKELTQKIARFCDVKPEAVVPLVTADLLYEIPLAWKRAMLQIFFWKRWAWKPDMNRNWTAGVGW
jgi:CTP synthase